MANTFHLKILNYHGKFFDGECQQLNIRTSDGMIGILKDHAPLLTAVRLGIFSIVNEKGKRIECYSTGGVLYVKRELTRYIADSVHFLSELNQQRAKIISERLKTKISETESKRMINNLEKDLNRMSEILKDKNAK